MCIVFGFCMYLAIAPKISTITLNIAVVNNTKKYFTNINLISILSNNILLTIQLIGGSIVFGIPKFCLLVYNGIIFGITLANTVESKTALSKIFLLTFPHDIFEIPAIIIAGAAGFKIPYELVRYLAGKKEQILTKEDIKEYPTLALISMLNTTKGI